jgi:hypothetical protein
MKVMLIQSSCSFASKLTLFVKKFPRVLFSVKRTLYLSKYYRFLAYFRKPSYISRIKRINYTLVFSLYHLQSFQTFKVIVLVCPITFSVMNQRGSTKNFLRINLGKRTCGQTERKTDGLYDDTKITNNKCKMVH